MRNTSISAEFLGNDRPARVRMCRRFADEAEGLAVQASNPEARAAYLDLKRQWLLLAEEMEQTEDAADMRN